MCGTGQYRLVCPENVADLLHLGFIFNSHQIGCRRMEGGNRRETSRAGKKREEDETDFPAKVTNKSNPAFSSDNIYFLWSANAELYQLRLCVYECIICAIALCRVVWGAKDEAAISQIGAS